MSRFPDALAAPTADVSWNSKKITNLADPLSAQDAATKNYVDGLVNGTDWKPSVRFAAVGNIPLSGLAAVDGPTAPVAGDRILAGSQTTASQNGIYIAAVGAWTRAADAAVNSEVTTGLAVFVEEGTANAGKQFVLTTANPITVGTTALTFTQFGGGSTYTAGNGITLTGSQFSVAVGTGLVQIAGGLKIDTTWVGQTAITTLGTVGTGTWQATVIGLAYGGTGANLSGSADGTIFKKSGTALVAAVAGTDYLAPGSSVDGGTF